MKKNKIILKKEDTPKSQILITSTPFFNPEVYEYFKQWVKASAIGIKK